MICIENNVLKMVKVTHLIGCTENVFRETGLKFKLLSVDICKTCDEYKMKLKHSSGEELQLLSTRY